MSTTTTGSLAMMRLRHWMLIGCLCALAAAAEWSMAQPAPSPAPAPATPATPVTAATPATPVTAATPPATPAPSSPAPVAAPPAGDAAALDARIQQTKLDVIQLNRDLLVLEEELLFPGNTQVAVFLSMDVGKLFVLESVQLEIDGKRVASHLYTPREVQALHRGGVQRLHLGQLRAGTHELTAFFTGQGPHDRDYRRGATVKFEKAAGARLIELRIRDVQARLQPEFEVKVLP